MFVSELAGFLAYETLGLLERFRSPVKIWVRVV
jgi:hypothetical protein